MTCRTHHPLAMAYRPDMVLKTRIPLCILALALAGALCLIGLQGCVTDAQTVLPEKEGQKILLVARVVAVITGDRARRFEPEVRQIEMLHIPTGERFNVTPQGQDEVLAVFLPSGRYEINRVQSMKDRFYRWPNCRRPFRWKGAR